MFDQAACILNSPWWLTMMWTVLSPFMASVTKSKIKWFSGNTEELHRQLNTFVADEELEQCKLNVVSSD